MAQIYGELVRAQLQSSATDLTPTATGLVYFNTSTGLKWYTGSAWKIAVDLDSTQTIAGKTLDATCSVNASALPIVTAAKGGLGTDASAFTGVLKASAGVFSAASLVNADVSASAAIDYSKLATMTAGRVLLGNASNVPTVTALSGDVTVDSSGVTAIGSGVIVNADVNASAAIAGTKISPDFGSQNVTTTGSVGGTNVLNAGYEEFTGIATPGSNPAAGKIRVYAKTDNKLYKLDSSGNEAAVGSGTGSGGVNYLVDWYDATKAVGTVSTVAAGGNVTVSGSFPAVTSAWYADATSGAAAIASSSNNTLRGTTNYLSALSGTSTSGATFVQTPVFNIDGEDLGKALSVVFDISGVTADDNYDVVAVRYNSSGVFQELTPIAGNVSSMTGTPSAKLPLGVKTFNGFFISGSTASDVYAIRFRRRAGSDQIRLDSLTVGPNQVLQGAIVTDWVDGGAITITGTTTNPTKGTIAQDKWWYRQVGDSYEFRMEYSQTTAGTDGSGQYLFTLPAGLAIDTTKIQSLSAIDPGVLGSAVVRGASNYYTGIVVTAITVGTSSQVRIEYTTTTAAVVGSASNGLASNPIRYYAEFRAPIAGKVGNTQQAARAVEEYASNSSTSDADDTTSFVYGPTGSTTPGTLTGYRQKRVRFQTPILPTDVLILEFRSNATGSKWQAVTGTYNSNSGVGGLQRQATIGGGFAINDSAISGTTDVDVTFGRYAYLGGATYGAAGQDWTTTIGFWRVRKVSSGAAVGFPVGARNVVGDTTGTAVPTGYIGEKVTFTQRSVTTTAGSWFVTTQSVGTLQPGVWMIYFYANVPGVAGLSNVNIAISTDATNSSAGIVSNSENYVGTNTSRSTQINATPWLVNLSVATNYYGKAFSVGAAVTATCDGFAVRIA